jgi:hypothetical protein
LEGAWAGGERIRIGRVSGGVRVLAAREAMRAAHVRGLLND